MGKQWQMSKTGSTRIGGYFARLSMAIVIGFGLVSFFPTSAHAADPKPVDLVLGGEGATSWNFSNLKPTDNGTSLVELRNTGSKAGFVTIWLSDFISNEGLNPESETGNTAEPGELIDHLLFNLSSNRTSTNLGLPATINMLPQSFSDSKYLEIVPLKAGDTANLQWEWNLPAQAGNDVQGDSLSFTINYLLREFEITDLSGSVSANGSFNQNVTVAPAGTRGKITIKKDTVGKTQEDQPLSEIWIIEVDKTPSITSANKTILGLQYDAGPHGTTFDRPVTLTFTYDPADIPEGSGAEDLTIATWDENAGSWVELAGSTVDTINHTISAPVTHFSRYTIVAPVPQAPTPPQPTTPEEEAPALKPPPITEEEPDSGGTPTDGPTANVTDLLQIDLLDRTGTVEIRADGTIGVPLTLTDLNGNFIIEVSKDTKITSNDGLPPTRIELTIANEPILVATDMIILSPVYKVTSYINEVEIPRVNFDPPARLTILYDPKDLPENVFPPFVAYYTAGQDLTPIAPPPGATDEVSKAKALLSHASLFVVAAELVPPPPPLPARFKVSNLTINPEQSRLGQQVTIRLEIANEGETAGSHQLQLKVDGIVRAIKEITLAAKSSETVSFEIGNLPVGKHQVEIAGLSGDFKIVSTAVLPAGQGFNWLPLDLSIAAAISAGLLALFLFRRKL